ncbi:hypothetical protein OH799_18655 [Nocardia sp. NBC_00881]|uniref:WXG100-like domain-containing protein n=1 Tax=Nocardia sp. NBC_00881 TaxID=2975995 RepID=UPI003869F204|nr:hypothetical protein OH799_18655 [Nocardia sp. NBC_00881]
MITLEIPGWLAGMAAVLNFDWTGAEHIDVREGELADGIGNSWLDSAGMLRELVSLLREIRDEVPEFLEGESGAAVQENLDLLLRGDYSLDVLADAMEQMGNSVRDSAASFQSAKILQLLFAAMTLYTIYKLVALLMATPGGAALIPVMVPAVHAIGRESVRAASVKLTANLAADAARAWLKNVLMPLLKKIAVPLPMVGKILGNTMMKGAAFGGSLQLGTQGLQKATGQRDRWNTSEMVSFTLSYALAFPAGHWAAKGISPVVAGWSGPWWVRMMAVGAGSGVAGEAGGWAGGIAAQLASGAPRLDTTGFGLASVLAGVGEGSLEAVTEGKRASMSGHPQLPRVQPTAPALKPDHNTPAAAQALSGQLRRTPNDPDIGYAQGAGAGPEVAYRKEQATAAARIADEAPKAGKPGDPPAPRESLGKRWVSTPNPQENRSAAASSAALSTGSGGVSTATDAGGSGSSVGANRAAGGVGAGTGRGEDTVHSDGGGRTVGPSIGGPGAAVNIAAGPHRPVEVGHGPASSTGEPDTAAGKQAGDGSEETSAPAPSPEIVPVGNPARDAVGTPVAGTPALPMAHAAVEVEGTVVPGHRGEPDSAPNNAATAPAPTSPLWSMPASKTGNSHRQRLHDDSRDDTHTSPHDSPDKLFTIPEFDTGSILGGDGAAAPDLTGSDLSGAVVSGVQSGRTIDRHTTKPPKDQGDGLTAPEQPSAQRHQSPGMDGGGRPDGLLEGAGLWDELGRLGDVGDMLREEAVVVGDAAVEAALGQRPPGQDEIIELSVPVSMYRRIAAQSEWTPVPSTGDEHPHRLVEGRSTRRWPRRVERRPVLGHGRFRVSVGWQDLVKHKDLRRRAWRTSHGLRVAGLPDYRWKRERDLPVDVESAQWVKDFLLSRTCAPLPVEVLSREITEVTGILRTHLSAEAILSPDVQRAIRLIAEGLYINRTLYGDSDIGRVNQIYGSFELSEYQVGAFYHNGFGVAEDLHRILDNGIQQKADIGDILLAMTADAWSDIVYGGGRRSNNPEGYDEKAAAELLFERAQLHGYDLSTAAVLGFAVNATAFDETTGRQAIESPDELLWRWLSDESMHPLALRIGRWVAGADLQTLSEPDALVGTIALAAEDLMSRRYNEERVFGRVLARVGIRVSVMGRLGKRISQLEEMLRLADKYRHLRPGGIGADGPTVRQAFIARLRGNAGFLDPDTGYRYPDGWVLGNRDMRRDHAAKIREIADKLDNDPDYTLVNALEEAQEHAKRMGEKYGGFRVQRVVRPGAQPWNPMAPGRDDGSGPEAGGIVGGDGSDVWRESGVAPGGTRAVECLVKGLERVRANTGNTGAVGDLRPGEIGARGVFPLAAQRASKGEFCEVGAWGLLEQRLLRMEPGATFLVVRQLVDADSHEFGLSDRGPGSHVVVLSHSKEYRGKLEFFDPDFDLPWVYNVGQRPADLDLSEDGDKVAVLYDHQGVVHKLPGRPVLPMFPVGQSMDTNDDQVRFPLDEATGAGASAAVVDGPLVRTAPRDGSPPGASTAPIPAIHDGRVTVTDELAEVEGRRDELLSKLGMRGVPGEAPTVPVRAAIATAREQLEAMRAEFAIRIGDVPVEDLDKITLSELGGLRAIDDRDRIRSRLAELTQLEQILDRHQQLMAELGVPEPALLVSVPVYGTVRGVENIRPDVELLDLRIKALTFEMSELDRELGVGDVLWLRPDSPWLVELRRRAEADRRALADELSVDPATLAGIGPEILPDGAKRWLRSDSLRNTSLAGVLLALAQRRTAIERRLRFVELVAERHHARAVFDREMSRRAMADEQVVAQVLRRSGLTSQRWERVSEHVLHLRTAETERDVLVVFTTAHRPDAVLDALGDNPSYASVLGPNPPYQVVFARPKLDTSRPRRSGEDVGIEIDEVQTLEPRYQEPDHTQIRAVLLEAYLDHRAEGKLSGVGFDNWIAPLGRVDARTTLAVLAGRVGAGPHDPYSAQKVARKLVSGEINGRYLVYEPPSGGLRGGHSVRIEIAGFPIDIVMNRDRDGVYRVVYRSFGDGNGPSQVLAARFGNLRTTSERKLAGAVKSALRDPDVEIAVAQPDTVESGVDKQPRSTEEVRPDPAWKVWEPGAGRGAWPAAVATRLHHPEARLAAGVLAARDVIAAEGGFRLGEGVTLVLGKVPRIVVAAPVADLESVLRRATAATSSQLAEAGITVIYHHVSVDDQGRVTVGHLPRSPKSEWSKEPAVYYSWEYWHLGAAAWNAATEAGLAHLDTRPVVTDPVFTTADGDTDWRPPLAQVAQHVQAATSELLAAFEESPTAVAAQSKTQAPAAGTAARREGDDEDDPVFRQIRSRVFGPGADPAARAAWLRELVELTDLGYGELADYFFERVVELPEFGDHDNPLGARSNKPYAGLSPRITGRPDVSGPQPSKFAALVTVLGALDLTRDDSVCDIGAALGKACLFFAAFTPVNRVVGIEIEPEYALDAAARASKLGLDVEIVNADALDAALPDCTVFYLYSPVRWKAKGEAVGMLVDRLAELGARKHIRVVVTGMPTQLLLLEKTGVFSAEPVGDSADWIVFTSQPAVRELDQSGDSGHDVADAVTADGRDEPPLPGVNVNMSANGHADRETPPRNDSDPALVRRGGSVLSGPPSGDGSPDDGVDAVNSATEGSVDPIGQLDQQATAMEEAQAASKGELDRLAEMRGGDPQSLHLGSAELNTLKREFEIKTAELTRLFRKGWPPRPQLSRVIDSLQNGLRALGHAGWQDFTQRLRTGGLVDFESRAIVRGVNFEVLVSTLQLDHRRTGRAHYHYPDLAKLFGVTEQNLQPGGEVVAGGDPLAEWRLLGATAGSSDIGKLVNAVTAYLEIGRMLELPFELERMGMEIGRLRAEQARLELAGLERQRAASVEGIDTDDDLDSRISRLELAHAKARYHQQGCRLRLVAAEFGIDARPSNAWRMVQQIEAVRADSRYSRSDVEKLVSAFEDYKDAAATLDPRVRESMAISSLERADSGASENEARQLQRQSNAIEPVADVDAMVRRLDELTRVRNLRDRWAELCGVKPTELNSRLESLRREFAALTEQLAGTSPTGKPTVGSVQRAKDEWDTEWGRPTGGTRKDWDRASEIYQKRHDAVRYRNLHFLLQYADECIRLGAQLGQIPPVHDQMVAELEGNSAERQRGRPDWVSVGDPQVYEPTQATNAELHKWGRRITEAATKRSRVFDNIVERARLLGVEDPDNLSPRELKTAVARLIAEYQDRAHTFRDQPPLSNQKERAEAEAFHVENLGNDILECFKLFDYAYAAERTVRAEAATAIAHELIQRDVIEAQGGRQLAPGVAVVEADGEPPQVFVVGPVSGLDRVLEKVAPEIREELTRRNARFHYRHVVIDAHGGSFVHAVRPTHHHVEPGPHIVPESQTSHIAEAGGEQAGNAAHVIEREPAEGSVHRSLPGVVLSPEGLREYEDVVRLVGNAAEQLRVWRQKRDALADRLGVSNPGRLGLGADPEARQQAFVELWEPVTVRREAVAGELGIDPMELESVCMSDADASVRAEILQRESDIREFFDLVEQHEQVATAMSDARSARDAVLTSRVVAAELDSRGDGQQWNNGVGYFPDPAGGAGGVLVVAVPKGEHMTTLLALAEDNPQFADALSAHAATLLLSYGSSVPDASRVMFMVSHAAAEGSTDFHAAVVTLRERDGHRLAGTVRLRIPHGDNAGSDEGAQLRVVLCGGPTRVQDLNLVIEGLAGHLSKISAAEMQAGVAQVVQAGKASVGGIETGRLEIAISGPAGRREVGISVFRYNEPDMDDSPIAHVVIRERTDVSASVAVLSHNDSPLDDEAAEWLTRALDLVNGEVEPDGRVLERTSAQVAAAQLELMKLGREQLVSVSAVNWWSDEALVLSARAQVEAVEQWYQELKSSETSTAASGLVFDYARMLGNLPGIPTPVRNAINQWQLHQDVSRWGDAPGRGFVDAIGLVQEAEARCPLGTQVSVLSYRVSHEAEPRVTELTIVIGDFDAAHCEVHVLQGRSCPDLLEYARRTLVPRAIDGYEEMQRGQESGAVVL